MTKTHTIIIAILFCVLSPLSTDAQIYEKCSDYYLSVALTHIRANEIDEALSFLYLQRTGYPGCPETEQALVLTIRIYRDKILEMKKMDDIKIARVYVTEFAEISTDSANLEEVRAMWKEIDVIDRETNLTAPLFWQIVGSAGLMVLYLTIVSL